MKCDVVLAGVGGQGVVTLSRLLAEAAHREGLCAVQGELHGMSQRGGAVQAHLRLSDAPVESPQVPEGGADLLVGVEPVETLRNLDWLRAGGRVLSAVAPVENVASYPPLERVLAALRALPNALLLDARELAKHAGSTRAENLVLAGAAAALLPISPDGARAALADFTARWSARDREAGALAFEAGLEAVQRAGAGASR